jgi:type IV secretion system protein VirD4
MAWALEGSENVEKPNQKGPYQTSYTPGWAAAAAWAEDPLFEARVRAVLDMEAKQRDSVKMTVTKVLTAWLLTANRDRKFPPLDLSFFDKPGATLYLLTPADGTVAAQAIVLMDQLINRQRTKVAQWEEFSRVGMFLDEITNTPIPRLPQYLAESRGLGVAICYAAQAGSQLDAVYGPLQGKAIRDVTPAALIMYGSHERPANGLIGFCGSRRCSPIGLSLKRFRSSVKSAQRCLRAFGGRAGYAGRFEVWPVSVSVSVSVSWVWSTVAAQLASRLSPS